MPPLFQSCCGKSINSTRNTDVPEARVNEEVSVSQLFKHPTIGEGQYDTELAITPRHFVETSKMEVDNLSGNTFVNQYLLIKDLGKGSYGTVKLALNMEDNCLYALKVVSKRQLKRRDFAGRMTKAQSNEDFLVEITVMKSLNHPNVVRLFEMIDDPTDDKLLMVMEFVDGGEVMPAEMIGTSKAGFPEDVARRHFRDLVKGLEYLHCQNIIHRDIKPGNLLLTEDGRVKLTDFGSASYCRDGNDIVTDNRGTRAFYAPEALEYGKPYSGKKADIYAAGVVLYMLIFAKLPFDSDNNDELFEMIRKHKPDFSTRTDLSTDIIDLIQKLICKTPDDRLSLEEVMEHDWFTNRARLREIKSSRHLHFPKVNPIPMKAAEAVTPSIHHIISAIPNKQQKNFKAGDYLIREGDELTGVFLIRRGYCEATSSAWESEQEDGLATGDIDFPEYDEDIPNVHESGLISQLSLQDSATNSELNENGSTLLKFKSLQPEEILKGVEKRSTCKHTQMKSLVETAAKETNAGIKCDLAISKCGRSRGPGTILGLDIAVEATISHQSVRALEDVETMYVDKKSLDEAQMRPDMQLQFRLLVSKLQRVEIMRDVVEKLATLHSDVVLLEKFRVMFRKH